MTDPTGPAATLDGVAPVPGEAATRLRGRALVLARATCVALSLLVLGLFALALPVAYAHVQITCSSTPCRTGQLTVEQVRTLEALGLSTADYAAYAVGLNVVFAAVYGVVATVLLWRRSDERMALFSALTLVLFAGATFTGTLDALATVHPVWRWPVAALDCLGGVAIILFAYLFPDGRFAPRWARWLLVPWVLGQAGRFVLPDSPLSYQTWPAPLALLLFMAGLGSAVGAQIYRYRRVSGPVQRQQTKWVIFAVTIALGLYLGLSVLQALLPPAQQQNVLVDLAVVTVAYAGMLLIPLAIGVAILRYRLWDVDVLLNRTLVYGALTAAVVALYALVIGVLGALLQAHGSPLVSVVATGVVAVLVGPLRTRLQHGVNHLIYGERDDPYAALSRLGRRLEGTLAPDATLPAIVETVRGALKLPYATITIRGHGADDTPAVTAVAGTAANTPLRLPLVYRGETVGELALAPRAVGERFTAGDQRLLTDLARQAGVAVHALRLHAQATQLARDLQQARHRLVAAREEERRRLRRDLHDGLGPQLGSQTFTLSAARTLLRSDPAAADALLADAARHARDAVVTIRELVHDLRPPALDDLGLVAALREQADRYAAGGVQITVEAPTPLPPLPAAVEVACYRIAQEALTNVARHAHAATCTVHLAIADGVYLEVRDDGRGFSAARRAGVGLASMRERAAEVGGSCTVESVPGQGARVRVRLPLTPEVG